MNVTGNYGKNWPEELAVLRLRVGDFLRIMLNEYGCTVSGPLADLLK